MKLMMKVEDSGLHWDEGKCKICDESSEILLACLRIFIDEKEIVRAWIPVCEECFNVLENLFAAIGEVKAKLQ